MEDVIKLDCNAYFWTESFVPNVFRDAYIEAWSKTEKLSFEQFYNKIRSDNDRDWWMNLEHVDKCYDSYVGGEIKARYPAGLPIYPHQVYRDIFLKTKFNICFE